ncbi:MAG: hypothetical protein ACLGIR_02360 [Actinomycetes bacterium]
MSEVTTTTVTTERRNPALVPLLLVLAVLVVGALVWFVVLPLFGGDEVADTGIAQPGGEQPLDPGATAAPTEQPGDTTTEAPSDPLVRTFDVFLVRDPFAPILATSIGAGTDGGTTDGGTTDGGTTDGGTTDGGTTDGGTTDGGTTDGGTTDGGTTDGGTTDGGTTDGGTTDGGTTGGGAVEVELLLIEDGPDGQTATIRVNGVVYDGLREGDTFADSFRLLDITDPCVVFLFGDSRGTACQGDVVLK